MTNKGKEKKTAVEKEVENLIKETLQKNKKELDYDH